jgi:glycolate oxidase FAD binding subunit
MMHRLFLLERWKMHEYALHGLRPHTAAEPASPAELAQTLRQAHERGLALVPWGGGTRQHVGRRPPRYDVALAIRRLNRIVACHPEEQVITVESGVTLETLQTCLARHGRWLPWDPAHPERATTGGLLASGATGAVRLGHASPRDWTPGMRVALGDGRPVKSGSQVVKHVAGCDAHKLHIGAFGTPGVIAEATFKVAPLPEHFRTREPPPGQRREEQFKVAPLPEHFRTLIAVFTDPRLPVRAVEHLRAAPLQPLALVALNRHAADRIPALRALLEGQPDHISVIARFAGAGAAVSGQVHEAERRCANLGARVIAAPPEEDALVWRAISDAMAPAADGALLLRAGAPSSAPGAVTSLLERMARRNGWLPARIGVAAAGLIFSRRFTGAASAEAVDQALLEARIELGVLGGYLVVEEAPPALAGAIDLWRPLPEGIDVMRALRARRDPPGILNPGRFVV